MPPPARPVLLEACVDALASARAAMRAGADRLELCGPGDGGTTPSHGLIACVRVACAVPLVVMIRPRPGPFTCTDDEFAVMRADVAAAKASGADGVVAGILRDDGRVDAARMATLVADAAPLPVTMHRAFDRALDRAADLPSALDALVDAGVARVLTSGGAPTALEGADALARLVAHAGGRVAILAGGGVRAHTVQAVLARSGVREVHARATDPVPFAELAAVLR